MGHYNFGTGSLFGVPSDTYPTPVRFGVLQDVSVDFAFSEKELRGEYTFPLCVARSGSKITGKAKVGLIQGDLFNDLFFAGNKTSGQILPSVDEAGIIPGTGAYTITVTHSGTFDTDLGVFFTATGLPLKRVETTPGPGEYSVALGIYTFNVADKSLAVRINYLYTAPGSGKVITITNELQGESPTFKVILASTFRGKSVVLILNSCSSSKLTLPLKNEDFTIPEFDFSAQADSSNEIGKLSVADY